MAPTRRPAPPCTWALESRRSRFPRSGHGPWVSSPPTISRSPVPVCGRARSGWDRTGHACPPRRPRGTKSRSRSTTVPTRRSPPPSSTCSTGSRAGALFCIAQAASRTRPVPDIVRAGTACRTTATANRSLSCSGRSDAARSCRTGRLADSRGEPASSALRRAAQPLPRAVLQRLVCSSELDARGFDTPAGEACRAPSKGLAACDILPCTRHAARTARPAARISPCRSCWRASIAPVSRLTCRLAAAGSDRLTRHAGRPVAIAGRAASAPYSLGRFACIRPRKLRWDPSRQWSSRV